MIPSFDSDGKLPPSIHACTWEEFAARFGTAMIKNERQYRITKSQAQKFEQSLAALEKSETAKQENLLLWQVQRDAIESQLNDLQEELQEYAVLINASADHAVALMLHSLREFPAALIKARIAAKLTQKALADQLGLQEQQIQRYEATEYASANLSRIIEVSETLGLKLELKGALAIGVQESS